MNEFDINISGPQFDRSKDDPMPIGCPDEDEFPELVSYPPGILLEYGLRPWNDINSDQGKFGFGNVLWLFPGEWYNGIPDGFSIVSILGDRDEFEKGVTSNDIRFGMLSYGILKNATANRNANTE